MGAMLARLFGRLFQRSLEVAILGLANAGKSTLLQVLAEGGRAPVVEETVPTIGLNVQLLRSGRVAMRCWDLGGQAPFRAEWARYAVGCDVILFVVDASDRARLPEARAELHRLLETRELATTPLCLVANKVDVEPHASEAELVRELNLDYIMDNPWVVVPVSARLQSNIAAVLQWLVDQAR
jgi:Arf/Sar family protein